MSENFRGARLLLGASPL